MLTKKQVKADFELNILPHVEDLDGCKLLWEKNLQYLVESGDITRYSANTWKFPKEYEKKFKKK